LRRVLGFFALESSTHQDAILAATAKNANLIVCGEKSDGTSCDQIELLKGKSVKFAIPFILMTRKDESNEFRRWIDILSRLVNLRVQPEQGFL
jgi:hypothetical protein